MKDLEKIKSEEVASALLDERPTDYDLVQEAAEELHLSVAAKQPYATDIDVLPANLSVFLRKVLNIFIPRCVAAMKAAYNYVRLQAGTMPTVQGIEALPASIRSIVFNDYQRNQDGYGYDPKAVYYTLCNEDTHTVGKSFIICFYLQGNPGDTIALSNAQAYLTSDGAYYTENTTHTWGESYKTARWVAYIGADSDFVINTHRPTKIYVKGIYSKIRTTYNSIGNIEEVVVPDGNYVGLLSSASGEKWSQTMVLRNIRTIGRLFGNGTYQITSFYFDGEDIVADLTGGNNNSTTLQFTSCIMPNITNLRYFWDNTRASLKLWWTPKLKTLSTPIDHSNSSGTGLNRIELPETTDFASPVGSYHYDGVLHEVVLPKAEKTNTQLIVISNSTSYATGAPFTYIYLGYDTNDRNKAIILSTTTLTTAFANLTKIELKDGWCKNLDIKAASALTKANVQEFIFDRLGVNTGGTLTIHLHTAVYDLFTTAEIEDVRIRTNITISRG